MLKLKTIYFFIKLIVNGCVEFITDTVGLVLSH